MRTADWIESEFERLAQSPEGIPKLREFVLQLAVQGKLVAQDSKDEPASELLKRIAAEKEQLVKDGKIKKPKPLPEIEEAEIPFEIPTGWEWVRLGDIGYTQTGTTPKKNEKECFGKDYPFIKPGDIYADKVDYQNEGLSKVGIERSGRLAEAGSILMVCIGTIGKLNAIDRACSFNQQINSVTPSLVESSYLKFCMMSDYFQKLSWQRSAATTISILNKGKWASIPVVIPPLAEQKRIVAKVDELMALCDELEAKQTAKAQTKEALNGAALHHVRSATNPAELDSATRFYIGQMDTLTDVPQAIPPIRETILQLAVQGKLVAQDPNDEPASELLKRIAAEKEHLVKDGKIKKSKPLPDIEEDEIPFEIPEGWSWARFLELGEFGRGKSKHRPRNDPTLYSNGKHKFVQTGDVARSGGLISTYTSLYNDVGLAQSKKWSAGTLCITIAANIADSGILSFDACFPDSVVGFVPSKHLQNERYFEYFMRTAKSDLSLFAPATAQKNINLSILNNVLIPLAPLNELGRIVAKVDELMGLCDQLESRLTTAQDLNQQLTQAILANQL